MHLYMAIYTEPYNILLQCLAGIKKELAAARKKVSASLKQALKHYVYFSGV